MTKLRWDKAKRNPNGYVSIDYGPEEIIGVDRFGGRSDEKQSSQASQRRGRATKLRNAAKAVSAKRTKPVSGRAWPDIADHTRARLAGKKNNRRANVEPVKHRAPRSAHGDGNSGGGTLAPVSSKKRLQREVLAYLIRVGPGRSEEELAKAMYGDVGRQQQVRKDCDLLVSEGWVERKARGVDKGSHRYFHKGP